MVLSTVWRSDRVSGVLRMSTDRSEKCQGRRRSAHENLLAPAPGTCSSHGREQKRRPFCGRRAPGIRRVVLGFSAEKEACNADCFSCGKLSVRQSRREIRLCRGIEPSKAGGLSCGDNPFPKELNEMINAR